ncbi:hypothetical protein [Geodermatophilus sp. SYSU D00684]
MAQAVAAVLAAAPPLRTGPAGPDAGRVLLGPVADHLARTARVVAAAEDATGMRRRMGAAALEVDAASDGSGSARWRATVAARLPSGRRPERAGLVTAVDAHTGAPVMSDRHSGVDLVDAVAASTAGGPHYRIGDRRYIDGGHRSVENADLAAGHGRVLVLAPLGGESRHPREWGTHLAAQVEALRAGGSRGETVVPDGAAEHLFGAHAMDPALRPPAARAGHDQGRALAGRLTGSWR